MKKNGQSTLQQTEKKGLGNFVKVEHGFMWEEKFNSINITSTHAHMTSTPINSKIFVNADTLIGYGGSTGNSTGTHNHYQLDSPTYYGGNNFFTDGLNLPFSNIGYYSTETTLNSYNTKNMYAFWFKHLPKEN